MPSASDWFDKFLPGIMRCRLDDLVLETPVQGLPALSARLGVDIRVKREDLQPVFSFKLRGAYAKLQALSDADRVRGVICASAGNHAQGVALAARHLGISAVVVMPAVTPEIKVDAVRKLDARVVIHGDDFEAACAHATEIAAAEDLTFIHPYDDPDVITGQGTIALELFRQCEAPPDYLFICVGGGGLAAGMALVARYLQPGIRIIGVEAEESASMKAAFEAGHPVTLERVGHFAEGVAVRRTGDLTFAICHDLLDEVITVDNDEICAAVQDVYEDTRAIAEPAGVLAIAGIKRYLTDHPECRGNVAAVLSGANVNFARLRHIAERAAVGELSEMLLAAEIPEEPGSFRRFCEAVGRRGITEFNYRYADDKKAHIFVGIQLRHGMQERLELLETLRQAGFPVEDLSDNEMAKLHVRHMVGGRASSISNEHLFRFEFPERPGALLDFLDAIGTDWNISLFHYRNHGSDYGRILAGIEVPPEDFEELEAHLAELGYPHWEESDNPAYAMFLG